MRTTITVADFCDWGCGMLGVQHTAQDALCMQRRKERYDLPDCALVYYPVDFAERLIAAGARREYFLPPTPDGYLPIRTRTTQTDDGGVIVEIGDLKKRLTASEIAHTAEVGKARTLRNALYRGVRSETDEGGSREPTQH